MSVCMAVQTAHAANGHEVGNSNRMRGRPGQIQRKGDGVVAGVAWLISKLAPLWHWLTKIVCTWSRASSTSGMPVVGREWGCGIAHGRCNRSAPFACPADTWSTVLSPCFLA